MKLFPNNRDIITRSGTATFGKRFLATTIDFLLTFILAIPLFEFAFNVITKKNAEYLACEATINEEIDYYSNFVKPTHLAYFVKDEKGIESRVNGNDEMSLFFVKKLLYGSYEKHTSDWLAEGYSEEKFNAHKNDLKTPTTTILDSANPEATYTLQAASYSSDDLAYFFTEYVPLHNENNDLIDFGSKTPIEYYDHFFKENFGSYFDSYFYPTVVDNITSYPVLRTNIAVKLFKYLFEKDNSSECKEAYSYIYQYYTSMQNNAERIFVNGKTYNLEHYSRYLASYDKQSTHINIDLIICFALAYLLIVLPFGFINSDGLSIGKRVVGIAVLDMDSPRGIISPLKHILRGIINIPAFSLSICLIGFIPPFSGSFAYLVTNLFMLGNKSITLFILGLIIFIVSLINIVPVLFTHYHQSLLDILFRTKVVDLKKEISEDIDTKDVGVH